MIHSRRHYTRVLIKLYARGHNIYMQPVAPKPFLVAGDDIRQKLEFHHVHLELGALRYIETFLFYWSWVFFQKKNPPWPIFVFENTRVPPLDLKKYFFWNRLKSFFYQSHWIAFGLTIPKWYNTWVSEIFFVNIFFKNIFKNIFPKIFWKMFRISKCHTILESWDRMQSNGFDRKII